MKLKIFIFAAGLLLLPASVFCAAVNIYHTSDAHGYYFPRDIDGKLTGGYAALAGYLARDNDDYLLLDSGDWTSGTYEAEESNGLLSVMAMNLLNYTASTIGNHEGDFGAAAMLNAFGRAGFDILAANISAAGANILPYKIYEINGKKIAVIGLAQDPFPYSKNKNIKNGGAAAFKKAMARVKKENPDAVIVLAHFSPEDINDKESQKLIAAVLKTKSVDLFLGGHIHTVIQNKKINGTIFAQSGGHLQGFSKITLDFDDKTGRLQNIISEYIPLHAEDTGGEIASRLNQYYKEDLDMVLTFAKDKIVKYNNSADNSADSPLGNLIADIIRLHAGTDIAIHGTAGMRGDLPAGDISKRVIFDIFPFPSVIFTAKVSGAFLKEFITAALKEEGSAFQYSAAEIKYSYKNNKAEDVQITVNGRPLQKNKMYTVSLTDFTAKGNEAGYLFKKVQYKSRHGDKTLRQILVEYMQQQTYITAPQTGRIQKI